MLRRLKRQRVGGWHYVNPAESFRGLGDGERWPARTSPRYLPPLNTAAYHLSMLPRYLPPHPNRRHAGNTTAVVRCRYRLYKT